jgi:hypothetical protein
MVRRLIRRVLGLALGVLWCVAGGGVIVGVMAQSGNLGPVIARLNGTDFANGLTTIHNLLDNLGTTRGSIIYRGASGYTVATPGTATYVLTSNGAGADPTWQVGGGGGTPGGTTGQGQYNNGGAFGGYTVGGDCTADFTTGAFTCTKTGGVSFATIATSGSASDLSTGTVPIARIPTGTTSSTVPLGNDARITAAPMLFDVGSPQSAFRITAVFPYAVNIASNVTWRAKCQTNPVGTMTIPWISTISGTPTTVNLSLSTSCVITNPGNSAYSFAATDAMTLDIPVDASAVAIGLSVLATK